jgi:hypothetical protein
MIAGSKRHLRMLAQPPAATPSPRLSPICAPLRRSIATCEPPSPQPASISFVSLRLRTLARSCTFSSRSDPLFSIACALFDQNTRGGIPSHASVRPISASSVSLRQSQPCRPFVFMVLRIAFPASPFVSQSSALPPGVGIPSSPLPHLPPLPPLPASPVTTFRINTCKSVSKQRTLTAFRMNTYEKRGGGGVMIPPPTCITGLQRRFSACRIRQPPPPKRLLRTLGW